MTPFQAALLAAILQLVGMALVIVVLWKAISAAAGLIALGAAIFFVGWQVDAA